MTTEHSVLKPDYATILVLDELVTEHGNVVQNLTLI